MSTSSLFFRNSDERTQEKTVADALEKMNDHYRRNASTGKRGQVLMNQRTGHVMVVDKRVEDPKGGSNSEL